MPRRLMDFNHLTFYKMSKWVITVLTYAAAVKKYTIKHLDELNTECWKAAFRKSFGLRKYDPVKVISVVLELWIYMLLDNYIK